MFVEAGLNRGNLYLINAIACVPKEPRREAEMKLAVKLCRPLLVSYLQKLPPETPTLVMGSTAQLALDGREKSVAKNRGFLEYEWDLTKVLP